MNNLKLGLLSEYLLGLGLRLLNDTVRIVWFLYSTECDEKIMNGEPATIWKFAFYLKVHNALSHLEGLSKI